MMNILHLFYTFIGLISNSVENEVHYDDKYKPVKKLILSIVIITFLVGLSYVLIQTFVISAVDAPE
tara:strand:- start:2155 stop:2352 length:198 start_codon:yes stop_codon:yes gene_type:complete